VPARPCAHVTVPVDAVPHTRLPTHCRHTPRCVRVGAACAALPFPRRGWWVMRYPRDFAPSLSLASDAVKGFPDEMCPTERSRVRATARARVCVCMRTHARACMRCLAVRSVSVASARPAYGTCGTLGTDRHALPGPHSLALPVQSGRHHIAGPFVQYSQYPLPHFAPY
jgi:hypothetical protein